MCEQNFKLCEGKTCKLCKRKLLSCVREKLFKLCEIKNIKLCEREHLSFVGEKFKLCEKKLSCFTPGLHLLFIAYNSIETYSLTSHQLDIYTFT